MAKETKFRLLIFMDLFLIILSKASPETNSTSGNGMERWCRTTPHPEVCLFFMSQNSYKPKTLPDFRDMLVKTAMKAAIETRNYVTEFSRSCYNQREKSALSDCLKLYNNTIIQLNRTLTGLTSGRRMRCSDFDAQTWLSSALTNIDMCRSGAVDLNVTDFIAPITTGSGRNVSELISNCLAINEEFLDKEKNSTNKEMEFPRWVMESDRKLLKYSKVRADLVVAKDGSGSFTTVQAAIEAAGKRRRKSRIVIYIKRGVYRENIEVGSENSNIMIIGDGMRFTIITSGRSVAAGFTTFSSATAGIDGPAFIARDISFINSAGPRMAQAVALRSSSDFSVFHRCSFQGYQDTLLVVSQRQFYKQCYIYGTIDFIFGNAAVVLQNCMIYVRRPLKGQVNVITAQAREDPYQNTGISIHDSQIRAAEDLRPLIGSVKTYLGRPWKKYARTVIMRSYIDSLVSPVGWLAWQRSKFAQDTLFYGEYKNFGPRASTQNRVRWAGFHVITSPNVASRFTVQKLIAGQTWLPATGVPFTLGL